MRITDARSLLGDGGLARELREVQPSAFLVPGRIVQRVIRHDRRMTGFWLRVPHRKSYVVSREALVVSR